MEKKEYVAPRIEVIEYKVEEGFAQSLFIGDVSNEDVTEGDDYRIYDNDNWY